MKRVVAIAAVALRRLVRDRSNIFFVFILPIGIVLLVGSVFGGGFVPTVGVVSPPAGELAAGLVARLEESDGFRVERFEAQDELITAVERGTVQAGVIIPDDYDRRLSTGEQVSVEYIARLDSGGPQLRTAIEAAVADESAVLRAARFAADKGVSGGLDLARSVAPALPRIDVETQTVGEALFPPTLGRFDLGAIQELVLFMFLTGLTGSAALIQARRLGVTRRMRSTPTSVTQILVGEALGRYAVVLVQGLYVVVFTLVAFGVNWGDPWGATAVLVVFAAVSAVFAMLFGALFRNDQQAGGVGVIVGLGVAALGGSMVPLEVFSPTMQKVAHLTPHAWALDAFAEMVRRGGGLGDILVELGVLVGYTVVFGALAVWRLRVVLKRA